MTDSLHFDITRTKQDYIRAHRAYVTRGKIFRAIWLLVTVFVALIMFIQISIFVTQTDSMVHWKGAASLVAVYITWVGLFYCVSPAMAARSTRVLIGTSHIVVDGRGIEERNPLISIQAEWKMFSAALETKSCFFVFRGRAGYRFYPKKMLGNEVIDRFRELIRDNVPQTNLLSVSRGVGSISMVGTESGNEPSSGWISTFQDIQETAKSRGLNFSVVLTKDDYKRMFRSNMRRGNMAKIVAGILIVFFAYFISDEVSELFREQDIEHALSGIGQNLAVFIGIPCFVYFFLPCACCAQRARRWCGV